MTGVLCQRKDFLLWMGGVEIEYLVWIQFIKPMDFNHKRCLQISWVVFKKDHFGIALLKRRDQQQVFFSLLAFNIIQCSAGKGALQTTSVLFCLFLRQNTRDFLYFVRFCRIFIRELSYSLWILRIFKCKTINLYMFSKYWSCFVLLEICKCFRSQLLMFSGSVAHSLILYV